MYSLIVGCVVPSDDTVIVLFLNITDLNVVKRLTELAISNVTILLSLTNLTGEDTFFNPVIAITDDMALHTAGFKEDVITPTLALFELDMNITLSFDETINALSMMTSYI